MESIQLNERIQVLDENIRRREKRKIDKAEAKDFSFVSANLSNFLPEIPQCRHEDFYIDLMQHRSLAVFHSDLTTLVNRVQATGNLEFLDKIRTQPFIFCNYHLGSYRALLGFLVKEGVDFALLLDDRTYTEQGEKITGSVRSLMEAAGRTVTFSMFNVEDASSMMRIGQWLHSGRSLVAYLDGNTGYGGIYSQAKDVFLRFDFMGMPMKNRKGIALLSYFTKVPVVPSISYFVNKNDAPLLEFHPPVSPGAFANKEDYVLNTTLHLYGILETKLRQYPSQWEPWLYIHKFLDTEELKKRRAQFSRMHTTKFRPDVTMEFNQEQYSLFRMGEMPYLFNRMLYIAHQVSDDVYNILEKCSEAEAFIPGNLIPGASVPEELHRLGIIRRIND